jgi:hypothetical protein
MQEQQQGASESSAREPRISEPVYTRPMPGGGYVRVELVENDDGAAETEHLRGRVVIERRTPAPATPEEEHVVVEDLEGDDPNLVMAELFRIARDNAAIARRVLRRQRPIERAD